MELNYNVKGERRKQLVKALEEILEVKSEYMGVPTFAYRIGRVMVDRAGTVTSCICQPKIRSKNHSILGHFLVNKCASENCTKAQTF